MNPEEMARAFAEQGIDPNTLPPEQLQVLMDEMSAQGGGAEMQSTGEVPQQSPVDATQMQYQAPLSLVQQPELLNPLDVLPEVILAYMDYVVEVRNDGELNADIKSRVLTQVAQAISSLVPLLPNDDEAMKAQQDMEMKQAEFQMKQQEMQFTLQFKQQEMQMKMEEMQMKVQLDQQINQQKLQQEKEKHQLNLVQSQEAHQNSMEQQKQASQLNNTIKQSNNKGEK